MSGMRLEDAAAKQFSEADAQVASDYREHAARLESERPDLAKRYREAAHHQEVSAACLDGTRPSASPAELAETRAKYGAGAGEEEAKGPDASRAIRFLYKNHRGETAVRTVVPRGVRWGSDEFHPEPQWLLDAWCLDRKAERLFTLRDMVFAKSNAQPVVELEGIYLAGEEVRRGS